MLLFDFLRVVSYGAVFIFSSMRQTIVRLDSDDIRVHLLCYLVCATLVSYGLTQSWSLAHLVESTRLWQAREKENFDWMVRIQLGQLALKICREHIKRKRRCPSARSVFTDALDLDMRSADVIKVWASCRDALSQQ